MSSAPCTAWLAWKKWQGCDVIKTPSVHNLICLLFWECSTLFYLLCFDLGVSLRFLGSPIGRQNGPHQIFVNGQEPEELDVGLPRRIGNPCFGSNRCCPERTRIFRTNFFLSSSKCNSTSDFSAKKFSKTKVFWFPKTDSFCAIFKNLTVFHT